MKILTVLGTRPEIIRLCLVIEKLDQACEHVVVHTGQNYDANLSQRFFDEMGIREPDHYLGVKASSFGEQAGKILDATERVMEDERPDRLLILGDTNSGLSAVVAKRLGIPVFHMEAGNRCFDDRVPEEVNRRIIDHSSDVLMPYTERSRSNLLREGIPRTRVFVTGNPILEVIERFSPQIQASTILESLNLQEKAYFLVTLHRAESVDVEQTLRSLVSALEALHREHGLPVIVSTHPHTRSRLEKWGIKASGLRFVEPFGLFDFLSLERHACCVLTDSGTVQEECCLFRIPNATLRDTTERPETIECGSNLLTGTGVDSILRCVRLVLRRTPDWTPPSEYLRTDVSDAVCGILLGYHAFC